MFFVSDQIYWPAAREHVEHCRLAGKSLEVSVYITETSLVNSDFNRKHVDADRTGVLC